jgi:hypothetical protein
MRSCPICGEAKWHTENGLAAHVWHDHAESRICMGHGRSSLKYGNATAELCSRSVMALCALRNAPRLRACTAINAKRSQDNPAQGRQQPVNFWGNAALSAK